MQPKILDLTADNAFDFCAVLDAVGIANVIGVFDKSEIASLQEGGKDLKHIGIAVAMKIAGVIVRNLSSAREPVYTFLAGCTAWEDGKPVTKEEIRRLKLGEFADLFRQMAEKEDIVDFFRGAAGSVFSERTDSGSLSGTDTQIPGDFSEVPSGRAD